MKPLILRGARLESGGHGVDLRDTHRPGRIVDIIIEEGRIAARSTVRDARVINLRGAIVLPGLADHHIHLRALAAACRSIDCSPAVLSARGGLRRILTAARRETDEGWLRGFGYDLEQSGWIDRGDLDRIGVGPVRIQDRTGRFWILDSIGLNEVLPIDPRKYPNGVETDAADQPIGHLNRLDGWLRHRIPSIDEDLSALRSVGQNLASRGVTSVTDATFTNSQTDLESLAAAGLPQRIRAMTRDPYVVAPHGVDLDAVKIVLDDDALPSLTELIDRVGEAHRAGRQVAVHCVSDTQVAIGLAAGLRTGDRIEHASFVTEAQASLIGHAGVAVAVQPSLVHTRGDRYIQETDPTQHLNLHRLASLERRGVVLLGSSDAPLGDPSPWLAIDAAQDRHTASGHVLGFDERLTRVQAMQMFWRHAVHPWSPRRIQPGELADLIVLDGSSLDEEPRVALTIIDGELVYEDAISSRIT